MEGYNEASGFKIKAYLVFTLFNPILFALPYPKFSPVKKHLTFLKSFSRFVLKSILLEFSTNIISH